MSPRPLVSMVVPFAGTADAATAMLEAIGRMRLADGDEVIVVDNSPAAVVEQSLAAIGATESSHAPIVLRASAMRSSYYARNVGAEHASCEWLLFIDSDCRPATSLLDDFFAEPVPPACGAISGQVAATAGNTRIEAWSASRRVLNQADIFANPYRPAAVTANLLVRRRAWSSVGGFLEGVRSFGDTDFCWRLQEAGWALIHRSAPRVEHRHRSTLRSLVQQMARYGAGAAWLKRRYPDSPKPPSLLRGLGRCAAGVVVWTLSGRFRRAAFKGIDAIAITATSIGSFGDNALPRDGKEKITILVDDFPSVSETFVSGEVAEMVRLGARVQVEAIRRPDRPQIGASRSAPVAYLEDEGSLRRITSVAWLFFWHPLRGLAELATRQEWDAIDRVSISGLASVTRRLEAAAPRHLHAHFATASAVTAQRASRILEIPFSVTAHGFDIWRRNHRLREKLLPAAFVTSGCAYNVEHLRGVVGAEAASRVHEVVMGVDPERFRRRSPYQGSSKVVAIGRLVEKKGFVHLIAAVGRVDPEVLDRLEIVGDGPLRESLGNVAMGAGVADKVAFHGALQDAEVREVLESADLLAAPCVVAASGDRDSMPVVVKEAMAMEVPVVASDEVGLPEAVAPAGGVLVPPGDPQALAEAIEKLLRMPAERRAAIGRAGRDWVLANATLRGQAARTLELIDGVDDAR